MGPRPLGRGWHANPQACAGTGHASMGPRPLGRGWTAAQQVDVAVIACFNGAATARSRMEIWNQ